MTALERLQAIRQARLEEDVRFLKKIVEIRDKHILLRDGIIARLRRQIEQLENTINN